LAQRRVTPVPDRGENAAMRFETKLAVVLDQVFDRLRPHP
jgi:hypothetical protein